MAYPRLTASYSVTVTATSPATLKEGTQQKAAALTLSGVDKNTDTPRFLKLRRCGFFSKAVRSKLIFEFIGVTLPLLYV